MASLLRSFFPLVFVLVSGCAYTLGRGSRTIPGGAKEISIPMFKNHSQETGIEVSFTQALLNEFLRSKVAKVVDDPRAEDRIEGDIMTVTYVAESPIASDPKTNSLPTDTVIASQYRVVVDITLRVVRRSDNEKLWEGRFHDEDIYAAPRVTLTGVNTVNPLYNLSARRQKLDTLAGRMMVEAHNRITENF